jgi:hypothetical protein
MAIVIIMWQQDQSLLSAMSVMLPGLEEGL